jgi:hypothetical protein
MLWILIAIVVIAAAIAVWRNHWLRHERSYETRHRTGDREWLKKVPE